MAIIELYNFRAKYPQYQDMSDDDLANALAKKYPQSYGDLPKKLSSVVENKVTPMSAFFNPATKTLTGKSLLEHSQSSSVFSKPPSNALEFMGEYGAGLTRDVGAFTADTLTTPANLAGAAVGSIGKVQQLGKTIAGTKVGQAVGEFLTTPRSLKPEPLDSRIFKLYNYAVGSKMKNVGEATKIQPNRINALKTINDNLSEIKLPNAETGALETRIPSNRLDLLHAYKQTKQLVWNKVSALSKGASEKNAQINLLNVAQEALQETTKNIGRVALKTNPNLTKTLTEEFNKIKSVGNINPTQAEEYMKFLNNEVQRLRNSGQAVDFSVKDLYSNMLSKLNEATDAAIEKALEQGGYREFRQQYSSLKSAEKEILAAANKHIKQISGQGGGVVHPLVDLWSLENVLQGVVTGSPTQALKGLLPKIASKTLDYFKSPDKRIAQIFKLLQKTKK